MLVADGFPDFSICGLPFYVSDEVHQPSALAHRTGAPLAEHGIEVLLHHSATELRPAERTVLVRGSDGHEQSMRYDTVVIATGARPRRARIEGEDLAGVHHLHTVADGIQLRARVDGGRLDRVAIVGAGYIGLEMADAFVRRGLHVTLLSRSATVLPTLDPSLGELLRVELERHGVAVETGVAVRQVSSAQERLRVQADAGSSYGADLVLLAAGVEPNSDLARSAGVALGLHGAIRVDRRMRTNVPGVLAAGDCVETWHRLLARPAYLPLGTTAHKQGRIAGETAAGGTREFQGSLGTQVVKVFELAAARTGLREAEARAAGLYLVTVETEPWDHKVYYPGARRLHIRITGDRRSGRLLGAQIVGDWRAEAAKRIDIFATAIHNGLNMDDLNDLDLSYTPPLGAPWDAIQEAAQAWSIS